MKPKVKARPPAARRSPAKAVPVPPVEPARSRAELLQAILGCTLIGLAGLIYFYRSTVFSGGALTYGDAGDVRFVNAILEHWWNVLHGVSDWKSPNFFHPLKGVLSWSEAFVLFSIPYVLLRLLGVDLFTAYQLSVAAVSLLAYSGMALLLGRTLRMPWAIAAAGAWIFAYSRLNLMYSNHPQMLTACLLPWMLMHVIGYWRRIESPWITRMPHVAGFFAILSLTAMTSMYVAWFVALFTALVAPAGAALAVARHGVSRSLATAARWFWRNLAHISLSAILGALLVSPVYWLHIWNQGPPVRMPWLVNYSNMPRPVWNGVGIGLLALVLAVGTIAAVQLMRRSGALFRPLESGCAAAITAGIVLAYALMVVSDGGTLWWYVYNHFPGGGAIRVVSRFHQVLQAFLVIVAALGLNALWRRDRGLPLASRSLQLAALGLCCLLPLEQHFKYPPTWSKTEHQARLASVSRVPQTCESFFFAFPASDTRDPAFRHIDTMLVAQRDRVPTIDGYSGRIPFQWPLWDATGPSAAVAAKEWAQRFGLTNVCQYSPETQSWSAPW